LLAEPFDCLISSPTLSKAHSLHSKVTPITETDKPLMTRLPLTLYLYPMP